MRQDKKGFTLIELLVVIAIIAILAAILFPVFLTVRNKARETQCISNSRQLGTALLMYADDYEGTGILKLGLGGAVRLMTIQKLSMVRFGSMLRMVSTQRSYAVQMQADIMENFQNGLYATTHI